MFAKLGRGPRTLTDSTRSRNHLVTSEGERLYTVLRFNQLDEAIENVAKGSRRLDLVRFVGLHTRSEAVCINQCDIEVLVVFIPSRWVVPPRE